MRIILLFVSLILLSCGKPVEDKVPAAIRGVWLTNVDSRVLNSRAGIDSAVNFCDELGINTIFVVTWNKGMTQFPSKIMKEITGVEIDTLFRGRDPLKELIESAHSKNIKVIAWFEFGFSSSFKLNGGEIIKLKPEWASKDVNGNLVTKNGFDWMNGFHPEVQDFLLSLIMEVVNNYNIDGIQGDDRLPAMPSEAGYDDFTKKLYAESNQGKLPPKDFKDTAWVQWRADLMTDFMKKIYEKVKSAKKDIIVSMAPSIYPWAKEEYLQDWPEWVRRGYVELICPQLYRYEFKDYKIALEEIVNEQVEKQNLHKFYPGILIKVGKYYPSRDYLRQMIEENRKQNINGEVFFFYEGLKRYADLFKDSLYNGKVKFPELLK
jgi:uncharacterized lipoprotein YddW (UPF0748 family)